MKRKPWDGKEGSAGRALGHSRPWSSRSQAATLAIHQMLPAAHGGASGIRDEGLLDSALASPRDRFLHEEPDLFQLAAASHALTRNHPFVDGNKRVALTLAGVFLELNGPRLVASEAEAGRATLALSTRELDEHGFAKWLRDSSEAVRLPKRTRRGS